MIAWALAKDKCVISKYDLDRLTLADLKELLKEGSILIMDGDEPIARIKKALTLSTFVLS